jgi:hypothetical protein
MKFKKIVGFGDSWIYGDELIDPVLFDLYPDPYPALEQNTAYREANCFLGMLGSHYQVPVENFGIAGGSLTSTMWTYQWWLDHETVPLNECLVLVGLTNSDRISHYNPSHQHYSNDPAWYKFVHSPWVDAGGAVPAEFQQLIKQQITLTTCPELEKLNYQQAVLFFDGVSARNCIPTIQFNIMPGERAIPNVPTLIKPDHSLFSWFVQGLQPVHGRKYIKEHGHPNEIGHGLIKDHLISLIDSCTMYEC